MTPDEIRQKAIERVARKWAGIDGRAWHNVSEIDQSAYRDEAVEIVDALGDLLPTGVEKRGFGDHKFPGISGFRRECRYVTEWVTQ